MQRKHRWILGLAIALSAFALACSGGDSASSSSAGGNAGSQTATAGDAAAKAAADIQQMTADGKSCVDLVKGGQYAAAISPCERAVRDASAVGADEIAAAFDQAKAAVADEAQTAAVQAAGDMLAGEDAGAAGKEAAGNLLKGMGGN